MVELLAGPFAVVDSDGALDITEHPQAAYTDRFGLLAYEYGFGGELHAVQVDGFAYRRSGAIGGQRFVIDTEINDLLELVGVLPWVLYEIDGQTGIRGSIAQASAGADVQVRCADRYLRFLSGGAVQWRALTDYAVDDYATECTLTGAGTGLPSISKTRSRALCVAYPTGEVLHYNPDTLEQEGGVKIAPANGGCWYSPKHDVLIVLIGTTTNTVSVYSSGALPTTISAPQAAPTLAKGQVSNILVRVTGDDGDGCPGELVDFSLSGPGTLFATQAMTDAEGYAEVRYAAPLSLSTDPTFTASLTI